ncbi:tRNA dihydrouridine synthase DusB [Zophobihabitans entericus]|uniref:tRNA-dihydrouridine synthase B n=1 Tax=Zophobihabitans entericus TaxID=1635327 RepID=A0A6G9IC63_9GAMM|nr:tRNA dihydrouridine synthase DusB [Zophobihabitans entericus]QIQ21170.1 tRNA dihydrouridine synthase DusB [Zophobihabitans entericus]
MLAGHLKIGNLTLQNRLIAAPMAGISDRPFRALCYQMGAGMTVSEMLLANEDVWHTNKSTLRMVSQDEPGIRAVQIVGSDPEEMAKAAKLNEEHGAQLIDINMGCPAKKVNKKLAGSALLQYPTLVQSILSAVVSAVNVPVTLKIRTGWDIINKNCLEIAQIAEDCGIKALTIHGRTRACLFNGEAEYDSIKKVKQAISIPVIANGDITSPQKAKMVLEYTGADALMIGRAAQGKPWIFNDIQHYLQSGVVMPDKTIDEVEQIVTEHTHVLHQFYGDYKGLRIARKHVSWYLQGYTGNEQFRRLFNAIDETSQQFIALKAFFNTLRNHTKS